MPKHTFGEIIRLKKCKESKLGVLFESYREFLQRNKVYDGKSKCCVLGCTKQAEYEGGDSRCYCGMCEEHARMKTKYIMESESIMEV